MTDSYVYEFCVCGDEPSRAGRVDRVRSPRTCENRPVAAGQRLRQRYPPGEEPAHGFPATANHGRRVTLNRRSDYGATLLGRNAFMHHRICLGPGVPEVLLAANRAPGTYSILRWYVSTPAKPAPRCGNGRV